MKSPKVSYEEWLRYSNVNDKMSMILEKLLVENAARLDSEDVTVTHAMNCVLLLAAGGREVTGTLTFGPIGSFVVHSSGTTGFAIVYGEQIACVVSLPE